MTSQEARNARDARWDEARDARQAELDAQQSGNEAEAERCRLASNWATECWRQACRDAAAADGNPDYASYARRMAAAV